jgi:hypothetical protein
MVETILVAGILFFSFQTTGVERDPRGNPLKITKQNYSIRTKGHAFPLLSFSCGSSLGFTPLEVRVHESFLPEILLRPPLPNPLTKKS